jgi:hypothetical protein
MSSIDRRRLLTLTFGAAASATIVAALEPHIALSAPLPSGVGDFEDSNDMVQQAQVIVIDPGRRWRRRRRRGRRRDCWWHRGRRVCRWRW